MSASLLAIRNLLSTEEYPAEEVAAKLLKDYFVEEPATESPRADGNKVFVYKKGLISVALPQKPMTKEDYVELFHAVKSGQYYEVPIEILHLALESSVTESLHGFRCDLLSDASRAGHDQAKQQLIDWSVKGDAVAASRLELKAFHCKDGLRIFLPKRFKTADELQLLGIHLKECGVGSYYYMDKPEYAHKLSQHFLRIAGELRRKEYDLMIENIKKARLESAANEANHSQPSRKAEVENVVREMYLSRVSKKNAEAPDLVAIDSGLKSVAPQEDRFEADVVPSFGSRMR